MDIVRPASVLPWTRSRPWARCFYIYSMMLLWDVIRNWQVFEQWCEMFVLKNICASATTVFELGIVITLFVLQCMLNYGLLMEYVACMLNHVRSWLCVGLFKILHDTRWTIGFIWAQVWQCDCYSGCHCTCALINWSVLPQLVSEQDLTLLATCVFKTKIFVFQN